MSKKKSRFRIMNHMFYLHGGDKDCNKSKVIGPLYLTE